MTDPSLALTLQVQQAMGEAFGRELADADPVVQPLGGAAQFGEHLGAGTVRLLGRDGLL